MRYTFSNGKLINIPDDELERISAGLGVSRAEAVSIWLEDAEYEINEEQEALDNAAKKVKISYGAEEKRRGPKKGTPRIVKVSNEKKELFHKIYSQLLTYGNSKVTILKENKLIEVRINEKTFKVDIIEERKSKK